MNRVFLSSLGAVVAASVATFTAACSGAPAAAVRPPTPTFADAARSAGCAIVDGRNEPFVVDWPADRRADLGAAAYEEGRGVAKDAAKAATIARAACDRGASESCSVLSRMYFQGSGVTRSDSEGVSYLERGCEEDDRGSCLLLGLRDRTGMGVPKDEGKATRYFTRACEAGIPAAFTAARRR